MNGPRARGTAGRLAQLIIPHAKSQHSEDTLAVSFVSVTLWKLPVLTLLLLLLNIENTSVAAGEVAR